MANGKSSLGFEKIGFKILKHLDVLICTSNRKVKLTKDELDFMPFWDEQFLNWRFSNPKNSVQSYKSNSDFYYSTNVYNSIIKIVTPKILKNIKHKNNFSDKFRDFKVKVEIGIVPKKFENNFLKFNLPLFLRKSPLNFIYLNLNNRNLISNEKIFFTFLDFDAF